MKPRVQIRADGGDVTADVADRLLDLVIEDKSGMEADDLSFTLDDRAPHLEMPQHGAELEVALGDDLSGLVTMGRWRVDETEASGPTRKIRVGATSADMASDLRAPRSRAWEGHTLGDIVASIAGAANLIPAVSTSLASTMVPYVAQTAESDLNLLTRLARRYGAIAKPAAGRLVLSRRGEETGTDGTTLPTVELLPADLSEWRLQIVDRGTYQSVEARWRALGEGIERTVLVGSGTPRRTLRHIHATEDEARRAAEAALRDAERGGGSGTLICAGFRPELFAGGRVQTPGLRVEMDATWLISRVEHRLDGALVTTADIERLPN